jgi:hypothetical protein
MCLQCNRALTGAFVIRVKPVHAAALTRRQLVRSYVGETTQAGRLSIARTLEVSLEEQMNTYNYAVLP